MQALAAALAPKAKACRDGKVETIDSVNLVPGDVIIIKFGDVVPADIKILPENDDQDTTPEDETPMSVSAPSAERPIPHPQLQPEPPISSPLT